MMNMVSRAATSAMMIHVVPTKSQMITMKRSSNAHAPIQMDRSPISRMEMMMMLAVWSCLMVFFIFGKLECFIPFYRLGHHGDNRYEHRSLRR